MSIICPNWRTIFDDNALDALADTGVFAVDGVLGQSVLPLQQESGAICMRQAMISAGEYSAIRGDHIHWLDDDTPMGLAFLDCLQDLMTHLNQTLYLGINQMESHYARYGQGFGYEWHTDNPKGKDNRVLSLVYYLNDNWQAKDGGALEVINLHGDNTVILPKADRLALFLSKLRHKVHIAHRPRTSIATWFRKGSPI